MGAPKKTIYYAAYISFQNWVLVTDFHNKVHDSLELIIIKAFYYCLICNNLVISSYCDATAKLMIFIWFQLATIGKVFYIIVEKTSENV